MLQRMLLLCIAFIHALTLNSCGKRKKKNPPAAPESRSGNTINPVDIRYYDAKPSINADGSRAVFVSGRDQSLKIYKYALGTDSRPSRVTSLTTDIGSEYEATISPNGLWILIAARKSEQVDLYLVHFDDTNNLTRITDDKHRDSNVSFSSDSRFFGFLKQDPSSNTNSIYVGEVNTNGIVNKPAKISDSDGEELAVFQPVTSTQTAYSLFSYKTETTDLLGTIYKRTFNSFAEMPSAKKESWLTGLRLNPAIPFVVGNNHIFAVTRPASKRQITPEGNEASPFNIYVKNEVSTITLTDKKVTVQQGPGYEILSLSAQTVANNAIWVAREYFSCKDNRTYGSSIVRLDAGLAKLLNRIMLRTSAEAGKWELVPDKEDGSTNICEKTRQDSSTGDLDYKIIFAAQALNPTSGYRIIYTTWYSSGGDHEVRLVDFQNNTLTSYEVSYNAKP